MATLLLLAALVALAVPYLILKVRYARFEQLKKFPQPPTSGVWGHLKLMGEYMDRSRKDAHSGRFFCFFSSLGTMYYRWEEGMLVGW